MIRNDDKNKTKMILEYLSSNPNGITSMEAINKFGVTRLSAVIFNLRSYGYNIISNTETSTDRFDNVVRYSRYALIPTVEVEW